MNDYERRFQHSLLKLCVPSWYTDALTSSSGTFNNSKQSIVLNPSTPWKIDDKEPPRTPEIVYIRFPRSYRSCRSSLATSPSPSIHSWHPNNFIENSRRRKKYEKGIERVSKSSRWYRPTQFAADNPTNNQIGSIKLSTSTEHKHHSIDNNKYDTPTVHRNDHKSRFNTNHLLTNDNIQNNAIDEQICSTMTDDKLQDNHIKANESQIMLLATTKEPSSCIESKVITDEQHDNKSVSMKADTSVPSITNIPLVIDKFNDYELFERVADDLVETILADVLLLRNLNDDNVDDDREENDQNSGVRELSEDENGLRELDEDDMNDTDEFIVFATTAEYSDDDQNSSTQRSTLNKLYRFSKTNPQANNDDDDDDLKHINSNQDLTKVLPPPERDAISTAAVQLKPNVEHLFEKFVPPLPIYQPQIEQKHTFLDKFIDEILRPSNSHLIKYQSNEGVNEETARIGRLLLDSIPASFIENVNHLSPVSTSILSELKHDIASIGPEDCHYDSPRHDYSLIQQRIIEEYDEELHDQTQRDSAYSSNQERINIQQSLYEPLSECYSGYSLIQNDLLTPNISSLQSTTDEAYESEPTTMSSSLAIAAHIHPDLEHEFEYPSPPPPVPDRRLKPDYLKSPMAKPRLVRQDNIDSNTYTPIEKTKPFPVATIQPFITSSPPPPPPSSNSSKFSATKTMSSRHYCGTIPTTDIPSDSYPDSTPKAGRKDDSHEKSRDRRNSRVLNCLYPSTSDDNRKRNSIPKSSSLNKIKLKKQKTIADFDEATNGLAIRLPAPTPSTSKFIDKQTNNKTPITSSLKRTNGILKSPTLTIKINQDRSPFFETSV